MRGRRPLSARGSVAGPQGALREGARELVDTLAEIVGGDRVLDGATAPADYGHDECLTVEAATPLAVVMPSNTDEVSRILATANELGVVVSARGSGTGMSGACTPSERGIVVSFERMNRIVEIDLDNHVAVVGPGVTLAQLDEAASAHGLMYPVSPGEDSASLGGNVATNAGGMRAVKYGVTRNHVLGLEAVLASGEIVRTGGKVAKSSSGYDLTQLLIGSEGTLALVTEVTLKLHPRPAHKTTVLAPFSTLEEVTAAVPHVVASNVGPTILEYIDLLTMAATTAAVGLDLGIPEAVRESALAYLVVQLENAHADRLDDDTARVSVLLDELGAMDVYVLPPLAAEQLIVARERAFFVAKAHGAHDIIDVVVPPSTLPRYMSIVADLAPKHGAMVAGCGHAGDGNVHLALFQADDVEREALIGELLRAGIELGGAISGEHGLGRAKQHWFFELEDPVKVALLRRIKDAFDPNGILGPGVGPVEG